MEFFLDGQLRDRAIHEIWIEFIDHFKRRLNLGAIGAQRIDDRFRMLFGRRGDIENIPRLDAGPTIINLFGNDLWNRFQLGCFAFDDGLYRR